MILSDNETKVDLLNNEAIAKTIVSLIKDSKEQPISIGIHGDCGAGKSSILEMVENEVKLASSVSGKKYSCIRFNGWKHQGFEGFCIGCCYQFRYCHCCRWVNFPR